MPPREEFSTERLEGAPSDDIGWHFGTPVAGNRNNIICKLCGKVIKGGITRLKQHVAHFKGQVAGCSRVTTIIREGMMKLLLDNKDKRNDSKKRKEEFEARLRGNEDDEIEAFVDEEMQMRHVTQESIRSHREWEDRQQFRQQTRGGQNVYKEGGSSHARARGSEDIAFNLRSTNIDLVRSKSMKQPKISGGLMKTLRKKLGEAVSKLIIYERLPMNLSNSPWLHNLITAAAEIGSTGVKFPTPYEISDVYLEAEYQSMREWINGLKDAWKERGVTIMCDGWTNSISHMHIMNFLVYCSRGTIFLKSIDVSSVASRNTDYYLQLLDQVVEEVGEEYVVQVVTDNEGALKAAGKKLMEKRPHLYWSPCAAHCLDLCLEDIGKKSNVQKVLEDAKMITSFIYNHIWTVNLMKEYTGGREIIRPAITRFATQFLQLQSLVKQKQALKNMFNSEKFKKSKFGKEKSGPAHDARKKILDNDFWIKANEILKVFEPIVKVLRLVDGDEKLTMGFIYEAIDRAKLSIQQNCRYHSTYNDMIDKRWKFLHTDLHSAGYFLNPQFQFGVEHSHSVYKETFDGTKSAISKLERNMDVAIRALSQLILFREKRENFGMPQAQRAWSQMDPAEWWMIYGSCTPELQSIAIKILSQTTSASNCERNWSTFSYIHTKTRNRLKYKKLQKLVFTFYNMKLRMREKKRRSQEEIENSFNPINLDYIFQEDDPLSPWIEEREGRLLDGLQNSEWLPRVDTDDEEVEADVDSSFHEGHSQGSDGGLSPPSNNSGGDGGNTVQSDHDINEDREQDPYQDIPYTMRDLGFVVDMTSFQDRGSDDNRRGGHQSIRGGRQQSGVLEDSSSSSFSQNFGDFGIGGSSQSSQSYYPPFYQQPPRMSHDHYPIIQAPPYYQPSINYQEPYYHQAPIFPYQQMENTGGGFFDYVFGQGARQDDNESESGNYDPPRHSTMW